MCGRFALATEKHLLEILFELDLQPDFDFKPRYNIAPAQKVPVVRLDSKEGKRELTEMKWGLVPFWAKDISIGNRLINARAETVAEKPSFRDAFKKRRLLVPASGFYEWKKTAGRKTPYYISTADRRLLALAGLWERWDKEGEPLETFTILTTAPNSLVAELHDRMPVIISQADYENWLQPDPDFVEIEQLFRPYPEEKLRVTAVSSLVNNPANEGPELLQPES
jgi:putative SOS response-associated peptidase YedK